MPPTADEWRRAVRAHGVLVVPGGATRWTPLEREDQWRELRRWVNEEPREPGWLVLKGGVPSHFVKSSGVREPLRVATPLRVCTYNALTSTAEGDPDRLSVYERELERSGKWRYWRHRGPLVCAALKGVDVAGLCEVTRPMLADVLRAHPRLTLVHFVAKPHNYDGSAVLVDLDRVGVRHVDAGPLESGMAQVFLNVHLHDRAQTADFCLCVLHLKSDGSNAHGALEDVRVRQARRALRKLPANEPAVVVGDLNSDRFLYGAFDEAGQTHVLDVLEGFASVLPLQPTYHHWNRAAFDHILVRGGAAVRTHVPDAGAAPCPNARHGSDHLPCYAHLLLSSPA